MITENQIREKLGHYLQKDISLDQFEDWLVQCSWNMHDSDDAAQKLVSAIELHLAEYSSGHLDEPALCNELLPSVTKYTTQISFGGAMPQAQVPGDTNNVTQRGVFQVAFPAPRRPLAEVASAGTLIVVEFA